MNLALQMGKKKISIGEEINDYVTNSRRQNRRKRNKIQYRKLQK